MTRASRLRLRGLLAAAAGIAITVGLGAVVTPASAAVLPARWLAQLRSGELPGTPEERQAAWDSLDSTGREAAMNLFAQHVATPVFEQAEQDGPTPSPDPVGPLPSQATASRAQASGAQAAGASMRNLVSFSDVSTVDVPVLGFGAVGDDRDDDALPDAFEDTVVQSFMPEYHVSAGERGDAGFTRFADQPDLQSTGPVLRQQPPLVHSRMTGVGGRWESGTLYGYLRADYLTLWNKDTGYDGGPLCTGLLSTPGLGALLRLLLNGHANDPERSATLVAAPVVWQDGLPRYNPDPSAYRARYQFTTSHEDFYATDESRLYAVNPPAPPGDHSSLGLYLAKSKHGTYAFNPDGHEVIITVAQVSFVAVASLTTIAVAIDDIFANRPVSLRHAVPLSIVLIVTVIVEDCFTESFTEQGGAVPTDPLNVGEPTQPLPGFAFAAGNDLRAKLLGAPKRAPRGSRDCHFRWLAPRSSRSANTTGAARGRCTCSTTETSSSTTSSTELSGRAARTSGRARVRSSRAMATSSSTRPRDRRCGRRAPTGGPPAGAWSFRATATSSSTPRQAPRFGQAGQAGAAPRHHLRRPSRQSRTRMKTGSSMAPTSARVSLALSLSRDAPRSSSATHGLPADPMPMAMGRPTTAAGSVCSNTSRLTWRARCLPALVSVKRSARASSTGDTTPAEPGPVRFTEPTAGPGPMRTRPSC